MRCECLNCPRRQTPAAVLENRGPQTVLSAAVALLVFFAAAARAGIVAPNLWANAYRLGLCHSFIGLADHVARTGLRTARRSSRRAASKRACGLMLGPLRHVMKKLIESHQARSAAKNVMTDLALNIDHQLVKHLERFGFVFDQRIPLPIRAQPDAVAQAVHRVKVLLPKLINRAQNRVTFD